MNKENIIRYLIEVVVVDPLVVAERFQIVEKSVAVGLGEKTPWNLQDSSRSS